MRFADGHTSDGVAAKIQSNQRVGVFAAQRSECSSLNNSEKHLAFGITVPSEIVTRAQSPICGACGCFTRVGFARGSLDAFIEHHDDIRAESNLDFERFFGRKKMLRAVQVRAKPHATVTDLAQITQAENLE